MKDKLDMLLNIVRDVLIEFDEHGTYLNIWTNNEALLANPREETLGMNIRDILPLEEAKYYQNLFKEVIETQKEIDVNYTIQTPKGPTHFIGSIIPFVFQGVKTVVLHVKDVTLEKQQEVTLANIGQIAEIGAWEYDVRKNELSWTDQTYLIHEIKIGTKVDGEKYLSLYDDDSKKLMRTSSYNCIANQESYDLELNLIIDGREKIVRTTGYPIVDANNETIKLAGTVQDITKHSKLSKEFEKQKNRLDQIIAQIPGVVFQYHQTKDMEVSLPYLSANFTQIFGIDAEAVMKDASLIMERFHPDDVGEYISNVEKSTTELSNFDWIGRIFDIEGKIKWVHIQSRPRQVDHGGIQSDGILFDVTEKKNQQFEMESKQKSLNHQLKLASLGKLSAGVAHEINNPLAIVNNVLNRVKKLNKNQSTENDDIDSLVNFALDASKRIETITKGLRVFSRADETKNETFNITKAIGTTVDLLNELYRGEKFTIEFYTSEVEHTIYGNRGRLDQALMNLVSNAVDAVKDNIDGKIIISLDCDDVDCDLKISDNGSGIPSEIIDKIFDPFFTTKDVGHGTGIGLSLVNSIVLEHNGSIKVESSNQVTTFYIKIPKNKG